MDLLQGDDELLLMELERRDGIYSFIFHELEGTKVQTDLQENQNKRNQMEEDSEESLQFKEDLTTRHMTKETITGTAAKSPLLFSTTTYLSGTGSSKSYDYADSYVKSSTTDFGKSWQTHFNFQFPMTSAHSSFQKFCSLRTFNVRRAKSPFSHIQTPLVRNRRHELKETKEYQNFMQDITKVADLRELFPLDPDVHAPFALETSTPRSSIKSSGVAVKDTKFLK